MIHGIAHENGSLYIIDSSRTESYSSVRDTLIRITASTKRDVEDLGTLVQLAREFRVTLECLLRTWEYPTSTIFVLGHDAA